ncbi:hypothetical protein [Methylocapsa sp. S129]|uniref:hypothetical protein n=1 Tax=Methylocapsa sp. S129 TaxID=1641869 RepID=UPI00131D2C4D|nr:hypothetical protein [Methylocapsa sp. S129]
MTPLSAGNVSAAASDGQIQGLNVAIGIIDSYQGTNDDSRPIAYVLGTAAKAELELNGDTFEGESSVNSFLYGVDPLYGIIAPPGTNPTNGVFGAAIGLNADNLPVVVGYSEATLPPACRASAW